MGWRVCRTCRRSYLPSVVPVDCRTSRRSDLPSVDPEHLNFNLLLLADVGQLQDLHCGPCQSVNRRLTIDDRSRSVRVVAELSRGPRAEAPPAPPAPGRGRSADRADTPGVPAGPAGLPAQVAWLVRRLGKRRLGASCLTRSVLPCCPSLIFWASEAASPRSALALEDRAYASQPTPLAGRQAHRQGPLDAGARAFGVGLQRQDLGPRLSLESVASPILPLGRRGAGHRPHATRRPSGRWPPGPGSSATGVRAHRCRRDRGRRRWWAAGCRCERTVATGAVAHRQ